MLQGRVKDIRNPDRTSLLTCTACGRIAVSCAAQISTTGLRCCTFCWHRRVL